MGTPRKAYAPKLRHVWDQDVVIKNGPILQGNLSSLSFSSISRFEDYIGAKAPPIDFSDPFVRNLLFFQLEGTIPPLECFVNALHLEDQYANRALISKIGRNGYFTFKEIISLFHGMAMKQPKGEVGYLAVDGFENVAYVWMEAPIWKTVVVSMLWNPSGKSWWFRVEYLDECANWSAGCRIFFNKKLDSKSGGRYASR